jgi:hypothetical protein
MIRVIRTRAGLVSAVSLLLALGVSTTVSSPSAAATSARVSKKSEKHKKAKKKKAAKRVASVQVSAGTETLVFSTHTVQALETAKASLVAVSPASGAVASGFAFPLAGGTLNPSTGFGSLGATGGLTLSTSIGVPGFSFGSEATISEPFLGLGSASTLSFTSQQATPPKFSFGTVDLKSVHPLVIGSTITLTSLRVSLTSTGARFLNEFASGAFLTGEAVGTVTVQVTASG